MRDEMFFVGQKAVINKDGKVLIVRDPLLPRETSIDLPGGKIQEGERDFIKAIKREVKEETSLEVTVGNPFNISYFEFSANLKHRNAGKKIYLVMFECFYKSGRVKLSREHDWYHWVDEKDFGKYFPKKTNVYFAIQKYFRLKSSAEAQSRTEI